jgi:D-3-phosphoglycerate dehydrogenase
VGALGRRPVGLRELIEQCDAVCVLLAFFTRYQGLLGERYLSGLQTQPGPGQPGAFQRSSTRAALAEVLNSGRMAAAWLDSLEPGALDPGRPLHGIAPCRSRHGWRAPRANRASAAPGPWRAASTNCSATEPQRAREFRPTGQARC